MQIKFKLSKETNAYFEPDGRHYRVANESGSILLTLDELAELKDVMAKAEKSKADFRLNRIKIESK